MSEDPVAVIERTPDGSVVTADGQVLFFSVERFVRDICLGDCCFICGAAAGSTTFNREHVLPRWILKRFKLFSREITLPNGTTFRYGGYTIPCCSTCNSLMGKMIEQPIREMLSGGLGAVAAHLEAHGPLLIFVWLSLIFVKTHLKDRQLKMRRDGGGDGGTIGELYDWPFVHHVHCVARSFLTRCSIEREAFGSILVLPAKLAPTYESFDFRDVYESRAILFRFGDLAILSVLDDGCGSLSAFRSNWEKITGPLSPIQLREVLAHLSYLNIHLRSRPTFWTDFSDGLRIRGLSPRIAELDAFDRAHLGEILWDCCGDILERFRNKNIEEIRSQVREGKHTFLWTADGAFDRTSMDPLVE